MSVAPIPRNIRASIQFHSRLNTKIWRDEKLRPEICLRLLRAANAFYKFLGIPDLVVSDILLTGSNAAYNYTKASDLDVHLVVDFSQLSDVSLAENVFATKKSLWSAIYDVKIRGHDLELYVENAREPAKSNGVYSILHGAWIKQPNKTPPSRNDPAIVAKVEAYAAEICDLIDSDPRLDDIDDLLGRLRSLRQNGLMEGGEFSIENLTYKTLRSLGYLDMLWQARTNDTNRELSLETTELPESEITEMTSPLDPADEFIDAIEAGLEKSSFRDKGSLSLHKFGEETVEISHIGVNEEFRRTGIASKVMMWLTGFADACGITLILGVADDADPETGLGWQDLHDWYERWGFEGGSSMKRNPRDDD